MGPPCSAGFRAWPHLIKWQLLNLLVNWLDQFIKWFENFVKWVNFTNWAVHIIHVPNNLHVPYITPTFVSTCTSSDLHVSYAASTSCKNSHACLNQCVFYAGL